jgi:hypothetical protein
MMRKKKKKKRTSKHRFNTEPWPEKRKIGR